LQVDFADNKGRLEVTQKALEKAGDEIVSIKESNLFLRHENSQLLAQKEKLHN